MPALNNPDDVTANIQTLLQQGKPEQVVTQLKTICNPENANPAHWYFFGIALEETGNTESAAKALETSLTIMPTSIAALTGLGRTYNTLKKHQEATVVLKQLLTLKQDHKPALLQLVVSYLALEQFDEAEAICNDLISASMFDVEALLHLGLIRKIQNQYDEAIALFDQALMFQPDAVPVLVNKGLTLQASGRVDEAITVFKEVAQNNPDAARLWHILAVAYLGKANLLEAINCLQRAFELDPSNIETGLILANGLRHAGRTSDCETICKKILEVDPKNAEALFFQDAYSKQKNNNSLDRIPAEVTRQMYKGKDVGSKFDRCLSAELDYKGPGTLNNAVRKELSSTKNKIDILELGCGSGLCGSLFSDIADRLIATDISPDMLEAAKEKNTYTELYDADLIDALDNYQSEIDLIIAMDVLCFFGDLTDIFKRCNKALRSDGLFGFSVVKPKTDAVWELQVYGHFVHSLNHLESVAKETGFTQVFSEELSLRREFNVDQYGYVCLYKKDHGLDEAK